jgi:hypothetical protein
MASAVEMAQHVRCGRVVMIGDSLASSLSKHPQEFCDRVVKKIKASTCSRRRSRSRRSSWCACCSRSSARTFTFNDISTPQGVVQHMLKQMAPQALLLERVHAS